MATTIRDYSTVTGGGYAVVHVDGCDLLNRTAVQEQAASAPGVWISDEVYADRTGWLDPRDCAQRFAKQFTVEFPVKFCSCAEWSIKDLEARRALLITGDC